MTREQALAILEVNETTPAAIQKAYERLAAQLGQNAFNQEEIETAYTFLIIEESNNTLAMSLASSRPTIMIRVPQFNEGIEEPGSQPLASFHDMNLEAYAHDVNGLIEKLKQHPEVAKQVFRSPEWCDLVFPFDDRLLSFSTQVDLLNEMLQYPHLQERFKRSHFLLSRTAFSSKRACDLLLKGGYEAFLDGIDLARFLKDQGYPSNFFTTFSSSEEQSLNSRFWDKLESGKVLRSILLSLEDLELRESNAIAEIFEGLQIHPDNLDYLMSRFWFRPCSSFSAGFTARAVKYWNLALANFLLAHPDLLKVAILTEEGLKLAKQDERVLTAVINNPEWRESLKTHEKSKFIILVAAHPTAESFLTQDKGFLETLSSRELFLCVCADRDTSYSGNFRKLHKKRALFFPDLEKKAQAFSTLHRWCLASSFPSQEIFNEVLELVGDISGDVRDFSELYAVFLDYYLRSEVWRDSSSNTTSRWLEHLLRGHPQFFPLLWERMREHIQVFLGVSSPYSIVNRILPYASVAQIRALMNEPTILPHVTYNSLQYLFDRNSEEILEMMSCSDLVKKLAKIFPSNIPSKTQFLTDDSVDASTPHPSSSVAAATILEKLSKYYEAGIFYLRAFEETLSLEREVYFNKIVHFIKTETHNRAVDLMTLAHRKGLTFPSQVWHVLLPRFGSENASSDIPQKERALIQDLLQEIEDASSERCQEFFIYPSVYLEAIKKATAVDNISEFYREAVAQFRSAYFNSPEEMLLLNLTETATSQLCLYVAYYLLKVNQWSNDYLFLLERDISPLIAEGEPKNLLTLCIIKNQPEAVRCLLRSQRVRNTLSDNDYEIFRVAVRQHPINPRIVLSLLDCSDVLAYAAEHFQEPEYTSFILSFVRAQISTHRDDFQLRVGSNRLQTVLALNDVELTALLNLRAEGPFRFNFNFFDFMNQRIRAFRPLMADGTRVQPAFQAEVQHTLGEIAEDRESSLRALSSKENEQRQKIEDHYGPYIHQKGIENLFESLKQELINKYEINPATVVIKGKTVCLPVGWKEFQNLFLTDNDKQLALEAYYRHMTHTALRYLSIPNFWINRNGNYVVPMAGGEAHANFEGYKLLIVLLWVAAKDPEMPPPDDISLEARIEQFISELAHMGRAHNWDKQRNSSSSGRSEEYDDLEPDNPTCYSGGNKRLAQALQWHPLLVLKLTPDMLEQHLSSFVYTHFRTHKQQSSQWEQIWIGIKKSMITGTSSAEEQSLLSQLNIPPEAIDDFIKNLKNQYQDQDVEESIAGKVEKIIRDQLKLDPHENHCINFWERANLNRLFPATACDEVKQDLVSYIEMRDRCRSKGTTWFGGYERETKLHAARAFEELLFEIDTTPKDQSIWELLKTHLIQTAILPVLNQGRLKEVYESFYQRVVCARLTESDKKFYDAFVVSEMYLARKRSNILKALWFWLFGGSEKGLIQEIKTKILETPPGSSRFQLTPQHAKMCHRSSELSKALLLKDVESIPPRIG